MGASSSSPARSAIVRETLRFRTTRLSLNRGRPGQSMKLRGFLANSLGGGSRDPGLATWHHFASVVPLFLRRMMWVDFRRNAEDTVKRLIWGVTTGIKPDDSGSFCGPLIQSEVGKKTRIVLHSV